MQGCWDISVSLARFSIPCYFFRNASLTSITVKALTQSIVPTAKKDTFLLVCVFLFICLVKQ